MRDPISGLYVTRSNVHWYNILSNKLSAVCLQLSTGYKKMNGMYNQSKAVHRLPKAFYDKILYQWMTALCIFLISDHAFFLNFFITTCNLCRPKILSFLDIFLPPSDPVLLRCHQRNMWLLECTVFYNYSKTSFAAIDKKRELAT